MKMSLSEMICRIGPGREVGDRGSGERGGGGAAEGDDQFSAQIDLRLKSTRRRRAGQGRQARMEGVGPTFSCRMCLRSLSSRYVRLERTGVEKGFMIFLIATDVEVSWSLAELRRGHVQLVRTEKRSTLAGE